jgi:ABC-2 type transport system ATP-binding protein
VPNHPSLTAVGLRKRYGDTHALDGFDLEVTAGSIHGLLGPNGAGKSTAVRCLATLVEPDSGDATIGGCDLVRAPARVRERIGLVGQNHAVDEVLSGRQNLVLFGRLSGLSKQSARARAEQLLARFDLAGDDTPAADRAVGGYSGGMRRRLDIAASLILTPTVLFLDEPTTGLDPRGRNEVWRAVRAIADSGTTVLLTTQYLDEADQLADRISVMDHGRVITEGTPADLKRRLGADRVEVVIADDADLDLAADALATASGRAASVDTDTRTLTLEAPDGAASLTLAVRALDAAGLGADDIALRRPTLDEVFLAVTGAAPSGRRTDEDATKEDA